jgi:hypothetical protein
MINLKVSEKQLLDLIGALETEDSIAFPSKDREELIATCKETLKMHRKYAMMKAG